MILAAGRKSVESFSRRLGKRLHRERVAQRQSGEFAVGPIPQLYRPVWVFSK
jgi:hypothetical protein